MNPDDLIDEEILRTRKIEELMGYMHSKNGKSTYGYLGDKEFSAIFNDYINFKPVIKTVEFSEEDFDYSVKVLDFYLKNSLSIEEAVKGLNKQLDRKNFAIKADASQLSENRTDAKIKFKIEFKFKPKDRMYDRLEITYKGELISKRNLLVKILESIDFKCEDIGTSTEFAYLHHHALKDIKVLYCLDIDHSKFCKEKDEEISEFDYIRNSDIRTLEDVEKYDQEFRSDVKEQLVKYADFEAEIEKIYNKIKLFEKLKDGISNSLVEKRTLSVRTRNDLINRIKKEKTFETRRTNIKKKELKEKYIEIENNFLDSLLK